MTNTTEIDWNEAPKDATHYNPANDKWYRSSSGVFAEIYGLGEWVKSCFSSSALNNGYFIRRPVSSKSETWVYPTPRNIGEEQMQQQRRQDIHAAIQHHISTGEGVPNELLQELIELNNMVQNVQQEAKTEDGWIENTQTVSGHPPSLTPETYIWVMLRNGDIEKGEAGKWNACWDTSENYNYDIVKYLIIGDNK